MARTKNVVLAMGAVWGLLLTHVTSASLPPTFNVTSNTTVCKNAIGGNATFGFTTTTFSGNLSPASFNLGGGQCQLLSGSGVGSVTESSVPPGWTFANLTFSTGRVTFINILRPTTPVKIDIQPGSCPNPLNVRRNGVVPVAILGSASFDVTTVKLSTLNINGVAPSRSALEDVATPFSGAISSCFDCTSLGPDGHTDLTLRFNAQALVATLGAVTDGECLPLTLTGTLNDGTPIAGTDRVIIIKH